MPKIPFRLYDFLAYLFAGALTIHALYLMDSSHITAVASKIRTGTVVTDLAMIFIAAYVVGIAWSVVTRQGVRRLVWRYSNPRVDYLDKTIPAKSPISADLLDQLKILSETTFRTKLRAEETYRLCREFVANNATASWERREAIVGVRSMCANCVGPTFLYVVAFFHNGWMLLGFMAVLAMISLVSKMITLDHREWKLIYFAFLATTAQTNNEEHNG